MGTGIRGAAITAIGTVALTAAGPAMAVPAAADTPAAVTVHVDATAPGRVIPEDFLGLSFEADQLHRTWTDPQRSNVDELIGHLGAGNLRFSANAVDNTAWQPDPSAPPPAWADAAVSPDDLSRLGALAEATDTTVDLGVNLARRDPAAAADEAGQARERIGPRLRSIQIGNEPNVYPIVGLFGGGERPQYVLPQQYVPDARAYRDAIAAAAPGTRISGPDTAGGAVGNPVIDPLLPAALDPWLDAYIAAFGAPGAALTQHYYPFVNTERMGFPQELSDAVGGLPMVDKLLSRETSDKQAAFLRYFVAKAEGAGMVPRISETNSVAMEGRPGVTDTVGAALWTIDYAMTAAREGVAGINLHDHIDDCTSYSMICFADPAAADSGTARVNPNYYGAYMVGRMAGGAVLPVTVDGAAHVSAFAVRMPDGAVRVIVDDMDRGFDGTVRVTIDGGPGGGATMQRLDGESVDTVGEATYAGTTVAADGSFAPGSEPVLAEDGGYAVRFGRPGAVLLTAG
ncbi:glycosyl hydrolase family 79 C-terminal domain-containing protein [Tomitella cavernea]|uniref:Beta-glucuronidase C-terminal domain-containing protein n=1 Tax=Tomitella cavernea TaxID=1387982 RepID=A0ABP9CPG8_9ACTN|nr:glycosyl hydrolase family 79 C-terminal domain-containing protein [Tomitella cavernea]